MEFGPFSGLDEMLSREWIITNGLGGYASSTVAGINTRRYHGLLAAPFSEPPFGRMMVLTGIEEEISGDASFHLSSSEYPSSIHPDGYKHLVKFSLRPFPTFRYEHDGVRIKKTVTMPHGKNATVIRYEVENPGGLRLKLVLRPLVSFRDIHSLMRYGQVQFHQWETHNSIELSFRGTPFLIMSVPGMLYIRSSLPEEQRWYRNVLHREERERGYDFLEDCYCPGYFESRLRSSADFTMIAVCGSRAHSTLEDILSKLSRGPAAIQSDEEARLEGLVRDSGMRELAPLVHASDSFLTSGRVIAGYHWFGCWGRDTLISLPGLTLVTRRHSEARKILLDMAARDRDGILPNWFDEKSAEYGPIDVSLLYIYAFYKYLCYTYDLELARRMWNFMVRITDILVKGREGVARIDGDCLVVNEGRTWMDAVVGGREVTPRRGKAVEINSMWYNALRSMEEIGRTIGEKFPYSGLSETVRESFANVFWNPSGGYLYDVVSDDGADGRVRPNQIFAVSMPFPVIEGNMAASVVDAVRTKLLTRVGLRSLAQGDPGYRGRCAGNQEERDFAYHQGTVWGWLIGPFITAFVRTGGSRQEAAGYLKYLAGQHLTEAGLGTISEIFDGDEPHVPRGCISQAWSVAEVLRAYCEDILRRRPEYELRLGARRD
ncbi:MAG: amylo-alpha-1,6-glucosidase [Candidatus Hadarchaeales archaeon]